MGWAKNKKPKVAEGKRKEVDISMMLQIVCHACGCLIQYTIKKPTEPQFCNECEKKRKKHKIPW